MKETSNRIAIIDIIRTIAIYLMVIFHFTYDLNLFGYNKISFQVGFWYWLPRVIVFLFLYCVGYSLAMSYSIKIDWKKYFKRFNKIAIYAVLISIVTYIMFPKNWIYFGTLHCIAVCTLLAIPFLSRPKLSLITAILIISSVFVFNITYQQLSKFVAIKSMDFIPFYPWFFVVLLGISQFHFKPWTIIVNAPRFLIWPGQKSLQIYLIHQPVFFGLIWTFAKLTR